MDKSDDAKNKGTVESSQIEMMQKPSFAAERFPNLLKLQSLRLATKSLRAWLSSSCWYCFLPWVRGENFSLTNSFTMPRFADCFFGSDSNPSEGTLCKRLKSSYIINGGWICFLSPFLNHSSVCQYIGLSKLHNLVLRDLVEAEGEQRDLIQTHLWLRIGISVELLFLFKQRISVETLYSQKLLEIKTFPLSENGFKADENRLSSIVFLKYKTVRCISSFSHSCLWTSVCRKCQLWLLVTRILLIC